MKRAALLLVLLAGLAGCGGHPPTPGSDKAPAKHFSLPKSEAECPAARDGHGSMGVCAPKRLGLSAPHAPPTVSAPTYADLSNNDPCYCGGAIRAAGHVGLIVKMNQGTGFIDRTASGMVNSARRAHIAVGGYDFDERYDVSEAVIFVRRLKAAGIYPSSHSTFPAIFDVEFGAFSLGGLRAQIHYVERQGYRVGVYTGGWYWSPHAGCVWVGVSAWLSGYPSAPRFCGLPSWAYHDHQYTDSGRVAGGLRGDLSIHFGTSFGSYVNSAPAPRPRPHPTPHPKPKPKPKPHHLSAEDKRLIAYWTTRRNAALRLYHHYACKPYSRGPKCSSLRADEHRLLADIRRRER